MTDILYKMFEEKFPNIEGVSKTLLDTYGAWERIYLTLSNKVYTEVYDKTKNSGPFISLSEIEKISKEVFTGIDFECKEKIDCIDKGANIGFGPQSNPKNENYYGHLIEIFSNMVSPYFVLNTGWRGNSELILDQRQKYLDFVVKVNDKFLDNARKEI